MVNFCNYLNTGAQLGLGSVITALATKVTVIITTNRIIKMTGCNYVFTTVMYIATPVIP